MIEAIDEIGEGNDSIRISLDDNYKAKYRIGHIWCDSLGKEVQFNRPRSKDG